MLLCIFCFSDAVAVTLINCLTSFFAGFVIFSVLGFMSHTRQVPIDRVAAKGLNMKVNAKCFVHCLFMWSFIYRLTCTIVHVHILLIFCLMIVSLIYCTERVFIEFIWSKSAVPGGHLIDTMFPHLIHCTKYMCLHHCKICS